MLNIAVGAIVGAEHKEGLSRQYDVAPYSGIGPGFRGFRKPDIVSLAGTMTKADFVPPDEYAMMIASGGQWAFEAGTKFYGSYCCRRPCGDITVCAESGYPYVGGTSLSHGAEMPMAGRLQEKKITKGQKCLLWQSGWQRHSHPLVSVFFYCYRVTFLHPGVRGE